MGYEYEFFSYEYSNLLNRVSKISVIVFDFVSTQWWIALIKSWNISKIIRRHRWPNVGWTSSDQSIGRSPIGDDKSMDFRSEFTTNTNVRCFLTPCSVCSWLLSAPRNCLICSWNGSISQRCIRTDSILWAFHTNILVKVYMGSPFLSGLSYMMAKRTFP